MVTPLYNMKAIMTWKSPSFSWQDNTQAQCKSQTPRCPVLPPSVVSFCCVPSLRSFPGSLLLAQTRSTTANACCSSVSTPLWWDFNWLMMSWARKGGISHGHAAVGTVHWDQHSLDCCILCFLIVLTAVLVRFYITLPGFTVNFWLILYRYTIVNKSGYWWTQLQ